MAEGGEDDDSKTEEPSQKKLEEAHKEGNFVLSQEMKMAASLGAVLVVVGMLSGGVASGIRNLAFPLIERPHAIQVGTSEAVVALFKELFLGALMVMAWPFAIVVVVAIAVSAVQTGGVHFVTKKIAPKWSKINPLAAAQRYLTAKPYVEFLKALAKMLVVGAVLFFMIKPRLGEIAETSGLDLLGILVYVQGRVYTLTFVVLIIVVVIAVADYMYQRWDYMKSMRMSKQEVRDEHKQSEGDPQIKGRLKSLRMQRARSRMMQAVPKADVVVTNPTHYAVALKYDMETMGAPVLVAKGTDLVAKRIRDVATENDVPIVENPPLARALYASVELDREIPPEHYKAVAEVIGYVMRLKGKLAR